MARKRPASKTGSKGSPEGPDGWNEVNKQEDGVRRSWKGGQGQSYQIESYLETRRQNNMVEAQKDLGKVRMEET